MAVDQDQRYVTANGRFLPTSLYDRSIANTMREGSWRPRLVRELLEGEPAEVLDLGCGSGTLAIAIAAAPGPHRVTGIDGDPEILAMARAKAGSEGVEWVEGLADDLPFKAASFDRVGCGERRQPADHVGQLRAAHGPALTAVGYSSVAGAAFDV
jgi:SAM-dependent methyltransferase